MDGLFFEEVGKAIKEKQKAWLVTIVGSKGSIPNKCGAKMLVFADGSIKGTIGGGDVEYQVIEYIKKLLPSKCVKEVWNLHQEEAAVSKDSFSTSMICGGVAEIFIEPLSGGEKLYIVGAGHCSIALEKMLKPAGFNITILDNREEWANRDKHPDADDIRCIDYHNLSESIDFGPATYVIILTHGHLHDSECLQQCVEKETKYLGVIGSKNKTQAMLQAMLDKGISKENVSKVFAPIGFSIGSKEPWEVALSISAQLLAVRNGVKSVSFTSNPYAQENV